MHDLLHISSKIMFFFANSLIRLKALDKHGITPILAAIWEGHTACVQLLLDKGATKNGSAPDGTSYVDAAEKPEIKKLLV